MMKTAAFAVLIPLFFACVDISIRTAGVSYLSKENMRRYLETPWIYLFWIALILLMVYAAASETAAIAYSFHRGNFMQKTGPVKMLLAGFRLGIRILRPRNILVFLFLLVFPPVAGTVFLTFRLLNLKIPYFITDLLKSGKVLTLCGAFLVFLLSLGTFFCPILLHVFFLERKDGREAFRRSRRLLGKRRFSICRETLAWTVMVLGAAVLLEILFTGPLLTLMSGSVWSSEIFSSLRLVTAGFFVLLAQPLIFSFLSNGYYNLMPNPVGIPNIDDEENYSARSSRLREEAVIGLIVSIAVVADLSVYALQRTGVIQVVTGRADKVVITAHRGASLKEPENTLAAFDAAIRDGADVVEFDIRQTKDGALVVMHDESLYRVTGVKKNVGDCTLAELQKLQVRTPEVKESPDYGPEMTGIPTLQQAIDLIRGRAEMNIEIKPADTDQDLPEKVAETILENDIAGDCVVTSLSYQSIRKVKKISSDIETVYVMALAMGRYYDLKYADAFSIKAGYINMSGVRAIHRLRKKVYAWTVDDPQQLNRLMLLDVDCIITNNPGKMRKAMNQNYYREPFFQQVQNYVQTIF